MTSAKPSKPTYAGVPLPEVCIMTNRLLLAETTEKILNSLVKVPHIRQINTCGESLPATINNGPNKGLSNNNSERKVVKFGEGEIELTNLVGEFYVEIDDPACVDETVEKIKKICDKNIKHGYTINVGRYSKYRPTLTDIMRC